MLKKHILKALIIALAILIQTPYILPTIGNLMFRITHIQDELLYNWVTFSTCILWIFLKWRNIFQAMKSHGKIIASLIHAIIGLTLCMISLVMELTFKPQDFFTAAIPASIFISGIFTIMGSLIPLAISLAYTVGIALPTVIGVFADKLLSEFSANTVVIALRILGIQASTYGANIRIPVVTGGVINAYIDHVCAGSTSLSVFICLFTLITIDLQPKSIWKILIFLIIGSLGTIAQATLRLIIMGLIGANYGLEAFLTTHKYLGYILFPIYFTIFTYIYMRNIKKIKL